MAYSTSTIYLGFEDEPITDKNKHFVDYTTNKVGGHPSWPSTEIAIPSCPICGLRRPLIVQIYAPLDNSAFHRMLYVFGCVNAVCSNQSGGWLCVRVQHLDQRQSHPPAAASPAAVPNINWCHGADDWGDDEAADGGAAGGAWAAPADANCNEPNGNVVCHRVDNRMSDDDEDESNSLDTDALPSLVQQLQLADGTQRNDNDRRNANPPHEGAAGRLHSPSASAEIEGVGDEDAELVTIDVPAMPKRDLIALLKQTNALPSDPTQLQLRAFFVAVEEAAAGGPATGGRGALDEHVRELLLEYQAKDDKIGTDPNSPNGAAGGASGSEPDEKYEKAIPMHGDVMFHHFVSTIQENPGQILRYSRNAQPLLVAQLPADVRHGLCENCRGPLLCELQLLPTIIPKLRFAGNSDAAPLEFANVLIFTCQKSCWDTPDRMRFERVHVQPEV